MNYEAKRQAIYREKNIEKLKAYRVNYYKEHRDAILAQHKAYYQLNKYKLKLKKYNKDKNNILECKWNEDCENKCCNFCEGCGWRCKESHNDCNAYRR